MQPHKTIHKCTQDGCKHKTKQASDLKKHLADAHDIGVKWHLCPQDGCEHKFKQAGNLKKHLAFAHDIGVKWHPCPQDGCEYKFKQAGHLNRHLAFAHDIGVKWHPCPEDGCEHKSKQASDLKKHLADAHDIGVKWHPCPQDGCEHKFKQAGDLKKHLAFAHDIGVKWHLCPQDGCEHKFKQAGDLKKHLANTHDIGVKWHPCPQDGCEYKFKQAGHLNRHLAFVHDIGDEECKVCLGACARLTKWTTGNGTTLHGCRKCFRKDTGKESRIELQYSDFLDANFGTAHLLATDQRIRGEACGRSYRPDKLYADPDWVLHVEIDEHQHSRNNGSYSCEERRISELYDEFPGKRYTVVRINPHAYSHAGVKPDKAERMQLLLRVMKQLTQIEQEAPILVVYMFYSPDNPKICRNLPTLMLQDTAGVATLESSSTV